jgi:alkylation response protein AidB-like acyl-CoA dehydrogenase
MQEPAVVANTRDLAPEIARRAAEIEAARRMPLDLVDTLKRAGAFRMLVPRAYGGDEVAFPASARVLEELSAADGAVGWTTMIGCETAALFSLLPKATFERIYQGGPDVICGGAFAPEGTADVTPSGFRARGRWGFASGCQHADWLFGNCVVLENGSPRLGALPGAPELRCVALPASQWEVVDTWRVVGMRGTGSHDVALAETLVPEEQTFTLFGGTPSLAGPLFAAPLVQFSLHIGCVALGIARGALEDLSALASSGKRRLYAQSTLSDSPLFQHTLGRSALDFEAAKALLHARVDEFWASAQEGPIAADRSNHFIAAVAWVADASAEIVTSCYRAGGGSALREASPLQRRLRDILTLTQHASVQDGVFSRIGAARLGKDGRFGL